jgi:hypothetical protein
VRLTAEHAWRKVTATLLVVSVTIALSACAGSHRSSDDAFSHQVRAICKTFAAEQAAAPPFTGKKPSPSAVEQQDRAASLAADRWFSRLRALEPPALSDVSVSEWRRTIDLERRDLRAVNAFYAKETPRLLRSFRKPHPTPKLPPGTGPTAATLAQAFNSPEGRRFLRLQQKLLKRIPGDYRAWTRLMQKVGLLQACSPHPARSTSTTAPATAPATTAHP